MNNSNSIKDLKAWTDLVRMSVEKFEQGGAKKIALPYTAAQEARGDLTFNGERLIIVPHNADYEAYETVLSKSKQPYLLADERFSSSDVVVGRIPRDARKLQTVMRSSVHDQTVTPSSICFELGRSLHDIALTMDMAPTAESFLFDNMLVLRLKAQVMLLPPIRFSRVTNESRKALIGQFEHELKTKLRHYDTSWLLSAFERGLDNEER